MNQESKFYECSRCREKVNSVFWHSPEEGDDAARPWLYLCDRCHEERKARVGEVIGLRIPDLGNSSASRLQSG